MQRSSAAREVRLLFSIQPVFGLLLDAVGEIACISETGDNI